MTKTLLTILFASFATSAFANEQYWVHGVDKDTGWVDQDKERSLGYNQYGPGYFNNDAEKGDGFLCWAASATDIITWWHQLNPGAQVMNPVAPHEQGAIWDLFKANFVNASGTASAGIEWYMNGLTTIAEPTPRANPTSKGDYYHDMVADIKHYDIREFDPYWIEYEGELIYFPDMYEGPVVDVYKDVANTMTTLLQDGYIISLGISDEDGAKHATTLWGVETDKDGYLTKMWITDSDDALNGYGSGLIELDCDKITNQLMLGEIHAGDMYAYGITSTGKEYAEEEFQETKAGRLWYDCNEPRNDYFYDFTAIKLSTVAYQGVPEPTTGTLSLLALAALAARRRRK